MSIIPMTAAAMAKMNSVFKKSTDKLTCSSISHRVGSRKSQLTRSTAASTNTLHWSSGASRSVTQT